MKAIPPTLLTDAQLSSAVTGEIATWRNLLPPEPWTTVLSNDIPGVVAWIRGRLDAGAHNGAQCIVNVKKGIQGTRPVPVVGIGERIAYRALSDMILANVDPPARSAEAYASFATGPIIYAYEGQGAFRLFGNARLSHVVEADIASFYQYVDHGILQRELEMQTAQVAAVEYLVELLGDIGGTSYGLPQLLDPSDALSEVYVRIMERDVVRRGLRTWRYNDDFRVGVTSYEAAQDALESLAEAARALGLVLNDHKTYISRFITYMFRYVSPDVAVDATHFDPDDLQAASDYTFTEDESAEIARTNLARLDLAPGDKQRIDLKRLTPDNLRVLRGAINSLRRVKDASALGRAIHLLLFAPALTPRLTDYLIEMHPTEPESVERVWDVLSQDHATSLSEWQATWLSFAARELNLLPGNAARIAYLTEQRRRGTGGLLHAEASLALADVGEVTFADLDNALRIEPSALAAWYVLAMRRLNSAGLVDHKQLQAVRSSSPLYRLLLDS